MQTAIENIVNHYDGQISEFICRKVNHDDCCHDIKQNVYVKVISNIGKIEKADNPRSYLFKMANNAVIDHYRNKSSKVKDELSENLGLPDDQLPIDHSLQLADCCLQPIIDALDPIYREALVMTELKGLSHKQYAEMAGISYTNAKTRVQRGRDKLKKIILANPNNYEFDNYGNIISCCGQKQGYRKEKISS